MDDEGDAIDVEEEVLHNAMVSKGTTSLPRNPKATGMTIASVASAAVTSTPCICVHQRPWSSRSC